ncbi:MAG: hypothetical protein NC099_01470 [Corallococcus sp.]|nr:spore maturation protein [Bacillota bacterium]MCM1533303.1 hypothetical protein [Corallococcus sp.]
MNYVVPIILILILLYGLIKKVNVYDGFVRGAKKSFDLSVSVFPYLAAMFIMVNALRASGLDKYLTAVFAPPFNLLGIPSEVVELLLLRPFTGSGSLALLSDVYAQYGADSYVGRCASVIMGSSETVFYVASVYFAGTNVKRTGFAIPIALFCNLIGGIAACLLCRIM